VFFNYHISDVCVMARAFIIYHNDTHTLTLRSLHNMLGNVWEWVDTDSDFVPGDKLKKGSVVRCGVMTCSVG
jgi:hypothetical protein